ncbi:MAG TPA: carboxypeptidase-like regulatory domain-containing protein, partial [Pyrinomonadaceae bacterium]|nr:carboxypeptidase-like regulatory domain-containing protein [Pyrinomonadaceae bacterium]
MLRRSFATLFLVMLFTLTLTAQAPSGDISGVVADPSGAIVPGVTVTLTNPATNAVRTALTNEAGLYVLRAIPPGVYNLRAELSGFR